MGVPYGFVTSNDAQRESVAAQMQQASQNKVSLGEYSLVELSEVLPLSVMHVMCVCIDLITWYGMQNLQCRKRLSCECGSIASPRVQDMKNLHSLCTHMLLCMRCCRYFPIFESQAMTFRFQSRGLVGRPLSACNLVPRVLSIARRHQSQRQEC